MKLLLLYLLTGAAWATSVTVPLTVSDEQCASWTVTGTTVTCAAWGNQPPPPPPPPNCQNMGDLVGDGHTQQTVGVMGGTPVYWRIAVPTLQPAWIGTYTSIRIASTSAPGSDHTRQMTLSKTPCDFAAKAPAYSTGISANLSIRFGQPDMFAVVMQSGEVWWLNVKQTKFINGVETPSCVVGSDCNFIYAASLPWQ